MRKNISKKLAKRKKIEKEYLKARGELLDRLFFGYLISGFKMVQYNGYVYLWNVKKQKWLKSNWKIKL